MTSAPTIGFLGGTGPQGSGLAHQVEALTANLIAVNKRYQAHADLRITDI